MEVLKKEILGSDGFQVMRLAESRVFDRLIASADQLGAPSEYFKVPTLYWIPELHKKPFKFHFISTSMWFSVLLTDAFSK